MRAGAITAVGRFRVENVTMIEPGSPSGGIRGPRGFPRYVELIESGLLDSATMVSHRITLDEVDETLLALPSGDAIRTVAA